MMPQSQPQEPLVLAGISGPGVSQAQKLIMGLVGNQAIMGDDGSLMTPDAAAELRSERPGTHLILLYPAPEYVVADSIQAGNSIANSHTAWRQSIEAVLNAARSNRACTTLVNAQAALADPAGTGHRLVERTGVSVENVPDDDGVEEPEQDPVLRVIAAYSLQASPELRPMVNEVEASSLPLGTLAQSTEYVEAACQAVVRSNERDAAHRKLQQENEVALNQVFRVQEELEKYYLENNELKKKVQKKEDEIAKKNEKTAQVQPRKASAQRAVE